MPKLNNLNKIKKIEHLREAEREFREKIATLILAGFGLVTALAWNDAIQTLFDAFFPKSNGLIGKFIYAFVVTAIVVTLSLQLKRISEKKE